MDLYMFRCELKPDEEDVKNGKDMRDEYATRIYFDKQAANKAYRECEKAYKSVRIIKFQGELVKHIMEPDNIID